MIQGLGTPTHSAVLDFLDEKAVPDLFVSSGALAWNQPEKYPDTFGWQPDYHVEGKIMGKYIKENFPNAKVGLFLQGDDFGRDGSAGAKKIIANQIVKEVTYTSGNTDVGSQIQQLKASGADLIVGLQRAGVHRARAAAGQGAGLPGAVVLLRRRPRPAARRRSAGQLLQGRRQRHRRPRGPVHDVLPQQHAPAGQRLGQAVEQGLAAKGNGKPISNYNIYGMSGAYTFAQTLAAAGKDVTRDKLVKTLEEKGSSFQGPALAPFEYSADSHRGITGVKVIQIKGGAPVDVTKVQTTDDEDGPVEEYTGTQAAPPANGVPTG